MKLTIPVSQTFTFVADEDAGLSTIHRAAEGETLNPDTSFTVKFRSATRRESDERDMLLYELRTTTDDRGMVYRVADLSDASLIKKNIELTLAGTSLVLPNAKNPDEPGIPLAFTTDLIPRIANSIKFGEWWGLMPPMWAIPLHEACLEVNPHWNPKRLV